MSPSPTVLLVAPTDAVARRALSELTDAGAHVMIVSTFAAARDALACQPDLLIAEVRLRAHNGLHLALRARAEGIPAIVTGHADPVIQRDADMFGASFVESDWEDGRLLATALATGVWQRPELRRSTHAA